MIFISYRLKQMSQQQAAAWLNQTELDYLTQVSVKRAVQFANGRALLRRMLQQRLQLAPSEIVIDLPSTQAPKLSVAGKSWQLSISHSGTAIAVACSAEHVLGIDIEQLKLRQFAKFSTDYVALTNATELIPFYQQWTAVEAYSKFSGLPLLTVLQQPLTKQVQFKHLLLSGFMLCLCRQHTDAEYLLYEDT
jgi:phosphopantetheinyl transferase